MKIFRADRLILVLLSIALAFPMLVFSTANVASADAAVTIPKTFSPPENLGAAVESVSALNSSFGVENLKDVLYTTVSGSPGVFAVVDLDTYQVLRSFELPGVHASWTSVVDHLGNVYIGGTGKLFKYSPVTATVVDLGKVTSDAAETYGLSVDDLGNVYGGTYPNSKLFKYDVSSDTFVDYGTMVAGQDYARSAAYHDGYLYAGIGIQGSLLKVDVDTGAKSTITLPTRPLYYDVSQLGMVYNLNVIDDYLFVHLTSEKVLIVYDMDTETWLSPTVTDYTGLYTSPKKDSKTYFAADEKIWSFHLGTHAIVDTGMEFPTYLRNSGWITIANDPLFPGETLATIHYGGQISLFNFTTQEYKKLPAIVPGQPTPIQTLEKGPDDKLYMSGYLGTFGAQYDPVTDSTELFSLGQAEGMASLGTDMYMGVYPGAEIFKYDTTSPPQIAVNPVFTHDIEQEQDRPFAITSGGGNLFVGTISHYGELGGALTIYDGTTWKTFRNVVQDQSIIGLAYDDGLLYGSTTVWGGLGVAPTATASKMFVWDVANEVKIAEFTPSLSQTHGSPKAIGGLTFGPDGLLWGSSYGTIFAMDPSDYSIVKSHEYYVTDWNFNHLWRPVQMRWSDDGLLYTTLGGKITVIDPDTLDHVTLQDASLMTLGDDGHIYYADGADLKRIQVADTPPPVWVEKPIVLTNPSFEDPLSNGDIPGWSSLYGATTPLAEYEISPTRASEGSKSLRIEDTSTTETVAVTSGNIPVDPGTEYFAKSDVYVEEGRSLFMIRFFDDQDSILTTKVEQITTGLGAWQSIEVREFAPAGASYMTITAYCTNFWMTTAFYDNIEAGYYEEQLPLIDVELPITNADLESAVDPGGIPGWTSMYADSPSVSYEVSGAQSFEGTSSLKLTDTSTSETVALMSDPITVTPDTDYTAQVQLYIDEGRSSFIVRYYDEYDQVLDSHVSHIQTGLDAWQAVVIESTAPATASYARLIAICSQYWMTTAYYDDFQLTYEAEQTP